MILPCHDVSSLYIQGFKQCRTWESKQINSIRLASFDWQHVVWSKVPPCPGDHPAEPHHLLPHDVVPLVGRVGEGATGEGGGVLHTDHSGAVGPGLAQGGGPAVVAGGAPWIARSSERRNAKKYTNLDILPDHSHHESMSPQVLSAASQLGVGRPRGKRQNPPGLQVNSWVESPPLAKL